MECTSRSSVVAFPPLHFFFVWLRNLRKKRHLQTEPFAPEAEPVCAHRYANEQNLLVQNEARYVSGMNLFQSFAGGPHFLGGKAFQPRPANKHTHTRTYLVQAWGWNSVKRSAHDSTYFTTQASADRLYMQKAHTQHTDRAWSKWAKGLHDRLVFFSSSVCTILCVCVFGGFHGECVLSLLGHSSNSSNMYRGTASSGRGRALPSPPYLLSCRVCVYMCGGRKFDRKFLLAMHIFSVAILIPPRHQAAVAASRATMMMVMVMVLVQYRTLR